MPSNDVPARVIVIGLYNVRWAVLDPSSVSFKPHQHPVVPYIPLTCSIASLGIASLASLK